MFVWKKAGIVCKAEQEDLKRKPNMFSDSSPSQGYHNTPTPIDHKYHYIINEKALKNK